MEGSGNLSKAFMECCQVSLVGIFFVDFVNLTGSFRDTFLGIATEMFRRNLP